MADWSVHGSPAFDVDEFTPILRGLFAPVRISTYPRHVSDRDGCWFAEERVIAISEALSPSRQREAFAYYLARAVLGHPSSREDRMRADWQLDDVEAGALQMGLLGYGPLGSLTWGT